MRAGKLDRQIDIGRMVFTENPEEPWIPGEEVWTPLAAGVRAQLMQSSTEEFLRAYGDEYVQVTIFRIRHLSGVSLEHQVRYDGKTFDIEEVKEIGRRKGLELRCKGVGS